MNGDSSKQGTGRAARYLAFNRLVTRAISTLQGCIDGVLLSAFSTGALHEIDEAYYNERAEYATAEHNCRGLWPWEQAVIDRYFTGSTIALTGAGAGREVLALHKLGYVVDAFECNRKLRTFGNQLLEDQGCPWRIALHERDRWPSGDRRYDGAIVGWGAYSSMRGRANRVRFLTEARSVLDEGAPLLVSFLDRGQRSDSYLRSVQRAGRVAGRFTPSPRVEFGDGLAPLFVHLFTRREISGELEAAGFRMQHFDSREYGHAVGTRL